MSTTSAVILLIGSITLIAHLVAIRMVATALTPSTTDTDRNNR